MVDDPLISCIAPLTADNLLMMSFGLPLLAWGLLAAAAPVIIHLVFRERAAREVFPAMRFLVESHLSATRAQWLRHLILMGARVMLIVLVVGMLGRFGCTREGGASGLAVVTAATPASVVFCIDNSASMGYRYQGQTRVQLAVNWARTLLDDTRLFGPGSQFAIVTGTQTAGLGVWREDRRTTGRLLDSIRPASHNSSAAQLLGSAYGLLSAARHGRREVYFFNDLTESSWAELPPPAPAVLTSMNVMDVGQDENRNVALGWPRVPSHALPANAPLFVPVRISSGELPCEPVLQFSIDGKPRGRQAAGMLAPISQSEVVLNIPALEPGVHQLEVNLEPGDALAADNSRFAWLVVGSLPRVGLVSGSVNDEMARMLQAMIAPPGLAASELRYSVEFITLENLLNHKTDGLIAIMVSDVESLNGLACEKLSSYVKAGGTLIVVPGPSFSPEGYRDAKAILPAAVESVAACDPPLRPAVSNLSHPFVSAFADLSIDSLNDRHAYKRLVLGQRSVHANVVFPFNDGTPALLEAKQGQGRTVLWAFSPAADWGQFGSQAAPTIVLVHSILESVRPALDNIGVYAAGRTANRSVGESSSPLLVRSQQGRETTILPAGRLYALPADMPQLYSAASKADPRERLLYYSVNVAESESQMSRIDGDILKSRFDNVLVRLMRPGDELSAQQRSGVARVNWGVPLGLVLITLLVVESSFANRFYRSWGR